MISPFHIHLAYNISYRLREQSRGETGATKAFLLLLPQQTSKIILRFPTDSVKVFKTVLAPPPVIIF